MAAQYVPATQVAVVENTTNGNFKVIGPGIHVFPFQPDLVPLASKVTKYSLRRQKIEIGTGKEDGKGIASSSNSPGNPVVYIQARGWATPNKQTIIDLHRKYGSDYVDSWVERNLVTTVKEVQGRHVYDFLTKNREQMATEIEDAIQAQLVDGDEKPLVDVTQLAITNFDFDEATNQRLAEVAQKNFEKQKAAEDIEIAKQTQQAELVKAETARQVAEKEAQATVIRANGEAEAIRAKYGNEVMSQAYLMNAWIQKWNGTMPQYQMGGATPLIQIPSSVK
jgi:regulator of protease activity HflC (stomatin/prohibitin superfamily)